VASLPERLRAALNEARKSRNNARTLLFSTVLSDLKNKEIELQHPASDDETAEVLRRGIKRRRESIEAYRAANRADLADREAAEVAALEPFLPAAPTADDIRAAVRAAIDQGARDLGKLMKEVMPRFKGRADGKLVNQIAAEELSKGS
jgi:uncharacterized protein YqeY